MARPGTPYETVNSVCNRLDTDGIKPSYRLVAAELDGNPSKRTILEHIDRWRDEQKTAATVPGLSDVIITALKAEIAAHMQADKQQSEIELGELREQNHEALEALESTEKQNYALENEGKELKDQLTARQQEHERIAAGAVSTIESLNQQVTALQKEREQLITAGESARTEAARAQLQLDQAVKAVTSAEKRETELNKKIDTLTGEKIESEKTAAVATARVEELQQSRASLIEELKTLKVEFKELSQEGKEKAKEHKTEITQINNKLDETRKQLASAEQHVAVLETEKTKLKKDEVKE